MGKNNKSKIVHVSVRDKGENAWAKHNYEATVVNDKGKAATDTSTWSKANAVKYATKKL